MNKRNYKMKSIFSATLRITTGEGIVTHPPAVFNKIAIFYFKQKK